MHYSKIMYYVEIIHMQYLWWNEFFPGIKIIWYIFDRTLAGTWFFSLNYWNSILHSYMLVPRHKRKYTLYECTYACVGMGIKMRTKNIRATTAYYNHWGSQKNRLWRCVQSAVNYHLIYIILRSMGRLYTVTLMLFTFFSLCFLTNWIFA